MAIGHQITIDPDAFGKAVAELIEANDDEPMTPEATGKALLLAIQGKVDGILADVVHHAYGPAHTIDLDGCLARILAKMS